MASAKGSSKTTGPERSHGQTQPKKLNQIKIKIKKTKKASIPEESRGTVAETSAATSAEEGAEVDSKV